MMFTNNQIGRIQLMVQTFSVAAKLLQRDIHPDEAEAGAMEELADLLVTAEKWSDLQELSDKLKNAYNWNCSVKINPVKEN